MSGLTIEELRAGLRAMMQLRDANGNAIRLGSLHDQYGDITPDRVVGVKMLNTPVGMQEIVITTSPGCDWSIADPKKANAAYVLADVRARINHRIAMAFLARGAQNA